jgi:chemotaxis response regulator CheB
VDDSKLVGRHLANMLAEFPSIKSLGQVSNSLEALDQIKALRPDVVILEVDLPAHNGFQILERIKREKLAPMVMVLTATPLDEYWESCREEAMADFFFDKTIGFGRVRQTFKQLLEKRVSSVH